MKVEIDEYQNYEKALGALTEAYRYLPPFTFIKERYIKVFKS